ncbi:MAG: hypothetical protein NVSMB10_11430 [Steroidobacteraceae bacterium]
MTAAAPLVNCLRRDLLAGAALAGQQHARFRGSDPLDEPQHLLDRGRRANHFDRRRRPVGRRGRLGTSDSGNSHHLNSLVFVPTTRNGTLALSFSDTLLMKAPLLNRSGQSANIAVGVPPTSRRPKMGLPFTCAPARRSHIANNA